MKKVKITAVRTASYSDLIAQYENPIEHACDVQEGQTWIANGWEKPEGFCDSAWDSISAFVMTLAHGGGNFYDGWMKNPKSAMISCNDGFRPVSFYLEALDEDV
ncbi:MAG: TIGR04076 family protein [Oscillospiraceae bacterium]|nr:TIGR04076 family protein [Oscillospiraceae bacterium]